MQAAAYVVTGLSGSTASVRLVGGTGSGSPASGSHVLNDLSVDQTGSLWVCVGSGTPGTWQQVGGGALIGHLTLTASTNAFVSAYGANAVVLGSLTGVAVAGCADSAGSFSGAPLSNATSPIGVVITPITAFTSTAKPLVVLFYSTSAGATGIALPVTYGGSSGAWTQFSFSLPIAVGTGVTLSCAYLILAVKP